MQVVRCFEDDDVIHVAGKIDPVADLDVINFELALADIAQLEKRQERLLKGRVRSREEEASQQVCLWVPRCQCPCVHPAWFVDCRYAVY